MPSRTTLASLASLIRLKNPTGWILAGLPGSWLLTENHMPYSFWILWWSGAFFARTAGCIVNDWCDQDIDKLVERTRLRPFAQENASRPLFLIMLFVFGSTALSMAYMLGKETLSLAYFIAPWILLYPSAKRWLPIPQLFLAPVFASSILMAHAITPNSHTTLWYIGTCAWILGYDTIYALSDLKDDQELPIFSAPKTLGRSTTLFVTACYSVFIVTVLVLRPPSSFLQWGVYSAFILSLLSQPMRISHAPSLQLFKQNLLAGALVYFLSALQY